MAQEMIVDIVSLQNGAEDFRYLLGRGYPRKNCLELIGNRYSLPKDQRELLHRGVFSAEEAAKRREKLVEIEGIEGAEVAIDGHNVLITVESALLQKPLIIADDGFVRDIAGVASAYKMTDVTHRAIDLIMEILKNSHPRRVVLLFDSPISKSGHLAAHVAGHLRVARLAGEARAVRVPETILTGYHGVVATSDSAIIDRAKKVADLAGHVIRNRIPEARLIKL